MFAASWAGFLRKSPFRVQLYRIYRQCMLLSGKRGSNRGLDSSDLSTILGPFRGHLFQGQSLSPVPRPPSLPFTHLWLAAHVPASLGMKSPTMLPRRLWYGEAFQITDVTFFSTTVSSGDDVFWLFRAFILHVVDLIAIISSLTGQQFHQL